MAIETNISKAEAVDATAGAGTTEGAAGGLSHIDERGQARMVDVSAKADTTRVARAEGFIAMAPETLELIVEGRAAKGDVAAWMEANAARRAWNACAIVKGQKYVYFSKKRGFKRRQCISVNKEDW